MTGPADVPHFYVAAGPNMVGATPGRCARCHRPPDAPVHLRRPTDGDGNPELDRRRASGRKKRLARKRKVA